jgi:membrane protease YdiL (CAAX protease family)
MLMDRKRQRLGNNSYWQESARPLTSLYFVFPFLLVYEVGMWTINRQGLRNGVDVWLRNGLDIVGFGQTFLLPVLTCGVLLGWHHLRGETWKANRKVLGGMVVESIGLGLFLLLWAHGLNGIMRLAQIPAAQITCSTNVISSYWPQLIGYLGAGIYEELFFRLMLIPILYGALTPLNLRPQGRFLTAVLVSSLLFSAAHYHWEFELGSWYWASDYGETFAWSSFLFRLSAGIFFGTLFVVRGFGIAVGAHALYDVLVVLS